MAFRCLVFLSQIQTGAVKQAHTLALCGQSHCCQPDPVPTITVRVENSWVVNLLRPNWAYFRVKLSPHHRAVRYGNFSDTHVLRLLESQLRRDCSEAAVFS